MTATAKDAHDYANAVVNNEIVTGKLIRQACKRHLLDLERDDVYFDEDRANHALEFFNFCTHVKGVLAGQPIKLEPWQSFIVASIFGWMRKEDGLRRYRKAYVEVARKNAKSTLTSGISLYMTAFDNEGGAECYSAAVKRDQAKIIWGDARVMAERSPFLRRVFKTTGTSIYHVGSASKFEALASDSRSLDGLNVHFAAIDELHSHKSRDVYDVLDTATGAREQPLMFSITTAGFNREGICYEVREYCTKVLSGIIDDDSIFAAIYTLDDEDDWKDESTWIKANPNIGVSVKWDDIRRLAKYAKETPTARNNFLTKRLNRWVSTETAWIDLEAWDRAPALASEDVLANSPCIIGLDLAHKLDVAAAVAVFAVEDQYHVKAKFWLPQEQITAKSRSIGNKYQAWAESGYLELTEGSIIDHEVIEEQLRIWLAEYDVHEIAFDPYGSVQLANRLARDGAPMVQVGQTVKNLSEAMKDVEASVVAKKFAHGDNPMLSWMFSNVLVEPDRNENIFPRKAHPDSKIDGAVATFTAVSRHIRRREAMPSVYEEEGLFII